jgi:hypothetical protein
MKRDAAGEFSKPQGNWDSDLDQEIVDVDDPRPLSDPSKTESILRVLHGDRIIGYSETPFFEKLNVLQGTPDPTRLSPEVYDEARVSLFEGLPVQEIPIYGVILTQHELNISAVKRLVDHPPADIDPAYAVLYDAEIYIIDGHHRLASGRIRGLVSYPAQVLGIVNY